MWIPWGWYGNSQVRELDTKRTGVCAYRGVTKLELEGGMGGIRSESLQGFLRHANDHGALCQRLGSVSLARRTLQRDCAIDGDGKWHKGTRKSKKEGKNEIKVQRTLG